MPKKRADGRYAKQITIGTLPDGRPKKKTIYGKTIKELEKNERDFLNLRDHGITAPVEKISVDDLLITWKKHKKLQKVSDNTFASIEREANRISKHLGTMKVIDVKQYNIEDYIATIGDGLSTGSINAAILRVKELFKYALEKDIIWKNPAQFIKGIPTKDTAKRALTKHERKVFEKAEFTDKERCFLSVLMYTGVRRGESISLDTSDIDFKKRLFTITKTVIDNKGKPYVRDYTKTPAGMRTIPIFDPLYKILKPYCTDRIGLLFTDENGLLYNNYTFNKAWSEIIQKARLIDKNLADDITPHTFRHTFASDLYDAGIDVKRAQYLLGHEKVKTTLDIYTHFDKQNLKADEMNAYYRQSENSQPKKKQSLSKAK